MALKDTIALGMSLPHRSPDPIDMAAVRQVAQRADALGFRDLWVTENAVDHVFSFDALVVLTHAAALTTRIRRIVLLICRLVTSRRSIRSPRSRGGGCRCRTSRIGRRSSLREAGCCSPAR